MTFVEYTDVESRNRGWFVADHVTVLSVYAQEAVRIGFVGGGYLLVVGTIDSVLSAINARETGAK